MLIAGIVLLTLWFLGTAGIASMMASGDTITFGEAFGMAGFLGGLFFVVGLILFLIGFFAEVGARRFNARDWAASVALTSALQQLVARSRAEAYAVDSAMAHVSDAALVEVDRHFDQDTHGQVLTTINTTTRTVGTTHTVSSASTHYQGDGGMGGGPARAQTYGNSSGFYSGTSSTSGSEESVLSHTTRANLMGDALFSVFETTDVDGGRDTVRAISLSRPAAEGVIRDLVGSVCYQVGGPETHAGGAVWAWVNPIVEKFAPTDISYVTDRLKAIHARPADQRESVAIDGIPMGRGAVLVTSLSINGATPLETYPAQFPEMFAGAVHGATQRGLARAHVSAINA
ncbi:MAG: hypothetical protein ACK4MD_02835 [Demequina sp.]